MHSNGFVNIFACISTSVLMWHNLGVITSAIPILNYSHSCCLQKLCQFLCDVVTLNAFVPCVSLQTIYYQWIILIHVIGQTSHLKLKSDTLQIITGAKSGTYVSVFRPRMYNKIFTTPPPIFISYHSIFFFSFHVISGGTSSWTQANKQSSFQEDLSPTDWVIIQKKINRVAYDDHPPAWRLLLTGCLPHLALSEASHTHTHIPCDTCSVCDCCCDIHDVLSGSVAAPLPPRAHPPLRLEYFMLRELEIPQDEQHHHACWWHWYEPVGPLSGYFCLSQTRSASCVPTLVTSCRHKELF